MKIIADNTQSRRVLRNYLIYADGTLPEDTFTSLEKLVDSPSGVDAVCGVAELLYARRDQLDKEGREVCGALAAFAATNFWHGMGGNENRGGRIAQAMARDNEEEPAAGTTFIAAEDDPAPLMQYQVQNQPSALPTAPSPSA